MTKRKVDRGTLLGVLIAVSGVVIGLLLDGGSLKQILQPTAAFIVLGGTLGAILIQFPMNIVLEAFRQMRHVLLEPSFVAEDAIEDLVGYCMQVRRHGMLILDSQLENITDLFLRKGLTFAVDGVPVRELRNMLEVDLSLREDHEESIASVLEAAGGFAPTLGIVGAVLGLIQVMQKMDNIGEIGKGIAVAFVSTLYGIGLANLCFLPLAGKLRIRMRERQLLREMTLDAVILIVEGSSTRALRQRLQSYRSTHTVAEATLPEPELAAR